MYIEVPLQFKFEDNNVRNGRYSERGSEFQSCKGQKWPIYKKQKNYGHLKCGTCVRKHFGQIKISALQASLYAYSNGCTFVATAQTKTKICDCKSRI